MLGELKNFKQIKKSLHKLPVIFLGSIEQHGPFMPIGTDTLLAYSLVAELEKRFKEQIIIFPTLPYGVAEEHLGFPGTISIEPSTYKLLIEDLINCLASSGFKKVLLLSTHGGNDSYIKQIQKKVHKKNGIQVNYLFAFDQAVDELAKELFGGVDKHAGSSENSIIAFLYPQIVGFIGKKKDQSFKVTQKGFFSKHKTVDVTKTGILNFSEELEVSPVKGKKLFSLMLKRISLVISQT